MSKDIRSFFSPLSKSKSAVKVVDAVENKKKNVRKRALIDSDSDEEPQLKTPKNSKANDSKASKRKDDETKSKYFEVNKNTVSNIFGNQPVKQVKTTPKEKVMVKNGYDELSDGDAAFFEVNDEWIETEFSKKDNGKSQIQIDINSHDKQSQLTKSSISSPLKLKVSPTKSVKSPTSPLKQTTLDGKKVKFSPKNKSSDIGSSPRKTKVKQLNEKSEIPSDIKKITPKKNLFSTIAEPNILQKDTEQTQQTISNKIIPTKINEKVSTSKNDIPNLKPKFKNSTNVGQKATVTSTSPKFELWVDKYRPTSLKQVIGQQGDKSAVNKLLKWLRNWYTNQSGTKKITKPSPWAKEDDGAYFKASLLSGPPGIGKTTTAHLVCKELEMDIVEYNASDTRSKKMLHDEITELLSSKSLSQFAIGGGATSKSHVLIMDEVDGMAGNEDRGGVQELISLIKSSKVPVICMCNDRNSPKIRSLANYCFDLKINRPRAEQIKGAMLSICFKENLKIKPNVLNEIISSTNQDIRLVLNNLSILAAKSDAGMNISSKDLKLGAWDVVRKVFSEGENKTMSIHDKCDLFFHDYSIAPLFVQENYLAVQPRSEQAKSKKGKMQLFAKAATSLCYGDLVEHGIRSQNVWSLLPTQALFSSVIPGDTLLGHIGGQINFPSWFGKNSRRNKLDRMAQEIQVHTRLRTSGTKESITLDYSGALKEAIVTPLLMNSTDGVSNSLEVMREYMLLREDLDSLNELTTWPGIKDNFAAIDSKVKAAFTRAYNKCSLLTPFSITGAGVKKVKPSGSAEYDDVNFSDENDVDDDDDINADGMILVKNKHKTETNEAKPSKKKKTETNEAKPSKKKKIENKSSKPKGGTKGRKK